MQKKTAVERDREIFVNMATRGWYFYFKNAWVGKLLDAVIYTAFRLAGTKLGKVSVARALRIVARSHLRCCNALNKLGLDLRLMT